MVSSGPHGPQTKTAQLLYLIPITYYISSLAAAGSCEYKYGQSMLSDSQSARITAATPAILLGTGFWALLQGFAVGKARSKYAELARKDGEKDVDERYLLPNLYAQGTSKHAKAFNCVQRSHQHIFETYTQTVLGGLAGMIAFPVCTAFSSMLYAIGESNTH
jgi:hypothetical protein